MNMSGEREAEYLQCMIEAGTDPHTAKLLYVLLQDLAVKADKTGTSTHTETCRPKNTLEGSL